MSTDWPIKLRANLIQIMGQANLTAAELARQSGVPKQTISDWLGGIQPRNLSALKSVAVVLGTSVDHLLFGLEASFQHGSSRPSQVNAWLQSISDHDAAGGMSGMLPWVKLRDARDMFSIVGFDGYCKFVSKGWEEVLAWTEQQILSRPFTEFVHVDDRDRMRLELVRHVKYGLGISHYENRYVSATGQVRYLYWNSIVLPLEGLVVAVTRDISETLPSRYDERQDLYIDDVLRHVATTCNNSIHSYGYECIGDQCDERLRVFTRRSIVSQLVLMLAHDISMTARFEQRKPKSGGRINLRCQNDPGAGGVRILVETASTELKSRVWDLSMHQQLARLIDASLAQESSDDGVRFGLFLPGRAEASSKG